MVVTNMKELCAYAKAQRKIKADEHRRLTLHDGKCSGLTDKEYNRVGVNQKKHFTKFRKLTHIRRWKYQSRYSVEQLKQITKL